MRKLKRRIKFVVFFYADFLLAFIMTLNRELTSDFFHALITLKDAKFRFFKMLRRKFLFLAPLIVVLKGIPYNEFSNTQKLEC